uniref:PARP catalytic domain-containing protein n=1 Tax=Picea sitchensis TaxID=3332 RepID=D5AC21_PICSI|nr:unknown [Picea sitchensis]
MVKAKANKSAKKHPRCIADGNELLRFHSITFTCSLGMDGLTNLCNFPSCNVCNIIRHGFSSKVENGKGIYTTASSGKAHDSIEVSEEDESKEKRAMLVCRVIAGRVNKSQDPDECLNGGYDSLAGQTGIYSNLDELFVFNPKAVLPCFVVMYKI